jgi:tetratricopeptide (TPR) repeat protein
MMRNLKLIVAAALLAPLGVAPAAAQPKGNQQQAEKVYTEGDALFQLRKYEEAAKKFIEAYEAWPVAEFLYNIAQSYRLASNCKEALYFYERFKKIKKRDGEVLEAERAEKIERFIEELQKCVAQTKTAADQQPDDINKPNRDDKRSDDPDLKRDVVAVRDDPERELDDDLIEEEYPGPSVFSARAGGGIALIDAGELEIPAQFAINVNVGYPLGLGSIYLEPGVAIGFSPIPFENTMTRASESASLFSAHANVGVTYPVNQKIGVRGDLGVGILSMGGLTHGNPFTVGGRATSGALGMLNVRFGIAAEYAFTPNVVATLTPFSYSYSPANEGLAMDSVSHIDFLVGLGYRM